MIIREKTIGEIFRISLWLKGAHSLLEILGGLALLLVSHTAILHFVGWITHGELLHDPQDLLARNLEQWATGFSSGSQSFAAWYLLSHGAIKLVLVAAVLRLVRSHQGPCAISAIPSGPGPNLSQPAIRVPSYAY